MQRRSALRGFRRARRIGAPARRRRFPMVTEPPPPVFATPVIPVSALLGSARRLIERSIPLSWISGEISNFTRASSGHCYFVLKDSSAQVRCVFFRSRAMQVSFPLRDGLQVEVRAQPTLYEARGEFQLTVDSLRLAGAGALFERFLRLKAALEARGWFAPERKRALPKFPRCIGIVTSPGAAALRDVLSTFRTRSPHVRLVIYPCSVQGRFAAGEVATAIATANARRDIDGVEALIVCRGGGSIEDLWSFNEESQARAIVRSELPIISGVGHETDFTICDFVADVRAPTPTGAAQFAAPATVELSASVRTQYAHLRSGIRRQLERAMQRTDYAGRRLQHPAARLDAQLSRLADLSRRLVGRWHALQESRQRALITMRSRLLQDARAAWPQAKRLDASSVRLQRGWNGLMHAGERRVERCAVALRHLNPEAVLDRGYAIVTRPDETIVQDSATLQVGEVLKVRFARGTAEVGVNSKE